MATQDSNTNARARADDALTESIALTALSQWISHAHFFIESVDRAREVYPDMKQHLETLGLRGGPEWCRLVEEGCDAFILSIECRLRDARKALSAEAKQ